MLLAIDVGNTNIVFEIYENERQKKQWRVETSEPLTETFQTIRSEFPYIKDIIVCSVVPKINDLLTKSGQQYFEAQPIFVTHENIDIEINIDQPEQLGADRMVGASAAVAFYQNPAVIVDFGTATTFDVIDVTGAHQGGIIAPGIHLSLSALEQAAAQLEIIQIEKPAKVIGGNTQDAMQSGIYWGYLGLIEGTIQRIADEMGVKPFVIATGGLAPLFEKGTDIFDIIDQDLIMRGLVHIHKVVKN